MPKTSSIRSVVSILSTWYCRSREFKIGLGLVGTIGDNVYAMYFSLFCISYYVTTSCVRCMR